MSVISSDVAKSKRNDSDECNYVNDFAYRNTLKTSECKNFGNNENRGRQMLVVSMLFVHDISQLNDTWAKVSLRKQVQGREK